MRVSQLIRRAAFCLPTLVAAAALLPGLASAQTRTFADPAVPVAIVSEPFYTIVDVLNHDRTLTQYATQNLSNAGYNCTAAPGLAAQGTAPHLFAYDSNLFEIGTSATSSALAIAPITSPYYNGCQYGPLTTLPSTATSVLATSGDSLHQRLFILTSAGGSSPETVIGYDASTFYLNTTGALVSYGTANLDTGATYTAMVTDQSGAYGDTAITELRTASTAGNLWIYTTAGRAIKILAPDGTSLPAINAFIIHNPRDLGGETLVLVNQDGLTATNQGNPPLDTNPFTLIDLGQLHQLIAASPSATTLTLPAVTKIAATTPYYAMLGAGWNPVLKLLYAVVGGGDASGNVFRHVLSYDPYNPSAPAETTAADVTSIPITPPYYPQVALNAAAGTMQFLTQNPTSAYTVSITSGAATTPTQLGATTFASDPGFAPTSMTGNPLAGNTWFSSSSGKVDALTLPPGGLPQPYLDLTAPEVVANAGTSSVNVLGYFPSNGDTTLSTLNVVVTATKNGGAPYTFGTATAAAARVNGTSISGSFPTAGIYTLTASFSGDSVQAAATSIPVVVAVGTAPFTTAVSLTATQTTTTTGTAVVTLTGSSWVPTGTLKVYDASTGHVLGSVTLSGPLSSPYSIPLTFPTTTTGVNVFYSGDAQNAGSGSSIANFTSPPTLTVTGTPSSVATSATVNGTVKFGTTQTIPPSGFVTIYTVPTSGGTPTAVTTVPAASAYAAGGIAFSFTSSSTSGSYNLYASYPGDTNYPYAVTSGNSSLVVNAPGPLDTTLTVTPPATAATNSVFKINMKLASATSTQTPSGSINVTAQLAGATSPTNIGIIDPSQAYAATGTNLTANFPTAGVWTISASFYGDQNFKPSTGTATLTVTAATAVATTLNLNAPASEPLNTAYTAVVKLTAASSLTSGPSGLVTLTVTSSTGATVATINTTAASAFGTNGYTASIPAAATAGTYTLTASYAGDTNYSSSSTSSTVTIGALIGTSLSLTAPSPVTYNTTYNAVIKLSPATISSPAPSGNVTLTSATPGYPTVTIATFTAAQALATGGYTVTIPANVASTTSVLTAMYTGDAYYAAAAPASTTVVVTAGPAATLSPTSLTFSSPINTTSGFQNVTLTNSGGSPLAISGITITGNGFVQLNGCPSTLAVQATCIIRVNFSSATPGTSSGALTVTDNATGSPQAVALTGTATGPIASVSPASSNFGTYTLGTSSEFTVTIVLTNSGTPPLTVSSFSLNNTADFQIMNTTCTPGQTLTMGAYCNVQVEFHPSVLGARTGALQFVTSDPVSAQVATFTGTGRAVGACADQDGDALCDDWETYGVNVRLNGVDHFIDLPAMGASPTHKDVFLQTDWMTQDLSQPGMHTHQPYPDAMAAIETAYNSSPVTNPDLTTGIHLHIDCGPTCVMNPVTGALWGTLSLASSIQEVHFFDPASTGPPTFTWTNFDGLSAPYLATGRPFVFHYAIFGHRLDQGLPYSGLSRNPADISKGASELIVALGEADSPRGTVAQQTGTLMHELGHNLGLQHGGQDRDNHKPNYLSVMNYAFQFVGLTVDSANGLYDYSRFALPQVDENNLNEIAGIGANPATYPGLNTTFPSISHYGTTWQCATTGALKSSPSVNGPDNWDCDVANLLSPRVHVDVSGDGAETKLTSYLDWPMLVFTGGSLAGNGATLPTQNTILDEYPTDQIKNVTPPYRIDVNGIGVLQAAPASTITLRVTLTNSGANADTYALNVSSPLGWANTAISPATVTLAAGATTRLAVTFTVPPGTTPGTSDRVTLRVNSQTSARIFETFESIVFASATPPPVALSTLSLSFSRQPLNSAIPSLPLTITNTGIAALRFTSFVTTAQFSQTNDCGTSLAVGTSCTVNLSFVPTAVGLQTGTLTITDSSTGSPEIITLSGTSLPAALAVPGIALTAPTTAISSRPVPISVTVSGGSTPTGTVTFYNDSVTLGTATVAANGSATLASSNLAAGTYDLYAVYSGDTKNVAVTAPDQTLTVVAATPTTILLSTTSTPALPGAAVTFTARLSGGTGTTQPTGNVTFLDGTNILGTGTLNASGVATFTTSTLALGAHSITATYPGDTVFAASTSTVLTQTIAVATAAVTTTTLSATPVMAPVGTSIVFTATVTSATGTPTGSVTLLDGTTPLGTATLNAGGVATFTTSTLAIATHSVAAQYAGVTLFAPSVSAAQQVVITGLADYSVAVTPTTLTLPTGGSATAAFVVTPVNGYAGTLTFSCSGTPADASCSFAPARLAFSATLQSPQTTTLTFDTRLHASLLTPQFGPVARGAALTSLAVILWLPASLLGLFGRRRIPAGYRRKLSGLWLCLVACLALSFASGCASNPATTPGTYTVNIVVSDGTASRTVAYTVIVTQ